MRPSLKFGSNTEFRFQPTFTFNQNPQNTVKFSASYDDSRNHTKMFNWTKLSLSLGSIIGAAVGEGGGQSNAFKAQQEAAKQPLAVV